MRVGIFPYKPNWDPHQQLLSAGLEGEGCQVLRIAPRKWFALQHAFGHDVDILHLDWPHDFYNGRTALRRALKRAMYLHGLRGARRRRLVWTAHNLITHDATDVGYETRMLQCLIDACAGVVCTSRAGEEMLRHHYRLPEGLAVRVIPLPGHYVDWYPNTTSREQARDRLGLQDAGRVVLSLGRLLPYKGLEELVGAFDRVASAGDALILAGWGPHPEFIAALNALAEPVRAVGRKVIISPEAVPREDVQLYYNACDLAAYPFRRILTSGSVMMAMSFGRCFVAPRMGAIPDVAPSRAFFGYAADDEDGLASALQQGLATPDLAARGAEAKAHAVNVFDWGRVARQATDFYRDLLGREASAAAAGKAA